MQTIVGRPVNVFSLKRAVAGFTLIELMITVALLGILAVLAIPAFNGLMDRMRIQSAANSLSVAFATARSESVKLGRDVSVCKSQDQSTCMNNGNDWSIGWIIYATVGAPIKVFDPPGGNVTMLGSDNPANLQNAVQFSPTGASDLGGTGSVTVCVSGQNSRVVSVSSSGRVRVAEDEVCP
jgi:type IV fimbrial biogenesis protein FimT